MNANELAQEFEEYLKEIEELPWGNHQILCDQAVTMLRQFDLAQSIIKQQELQIQDLKDEMAEWKMSYENCHRMCNGYGMN